MAAHIGIVAVSPEGAALCYRQIFRHAANMIPPEHHPIVTVHNLPLAGYVAAVRANDWEAVGRMLRQSAMTLAGCGADFCLTPDNAVHFGVPLAETGCAIPWLTMTGLVSEAVERDGRRVVGIIGTSAVTMGAAYQTYLGLRGIQVLPPSPEDTAALDRIIFDELAFGRSRRESQERVHAIIERQRASGCEAVILAWSESGLVVTKESSPLPLYDAADLLAQGAVREALRLSRIQLAGLGTEG